MKPVIRNTCVIAACAILATSCNTVSNSNVSRDRSDRPAASRGDIAKSGDGVIHIPRWRPGNPDDTDGKPGEPNCPDCDGNGPVYVGSERP